jgi:Replication protein.
MSAPAALGEDYGYCFRPGQEGTASTPSKWAQLRKAKELLPEIGRFHACHHNPDKRALGIGVYVGDRSAWFGQVYRCGNVWTCPICSRRVSEHRREDIQHAIDNAIRRGWGVSLVTLTFPHGAGDQLADILEKFTKAQRSFKSGRAASKLRERIEFEGEIRTLEVTHGANGWHPHAHSIWITRKQYSQEGLEALESELYIAWRAACIKAGLPEPSRDHGVDVRGAKYAAEYVAKWGFATELAGGHSKRGKLKGRTPWQLLAGATEGAKRDEWLWREFALAFYGKRQLFWSRGLRKTLDLAPELTEQELLDLEDRRIERQIVVLDLDTWYVIRKSDSQGEVLRLAETDRIGMFALLNRLRSTVPIENGKPPGIREDWEQ